MNVAVFDPKLKQVAEEIKAIIKKHDVGGTVSLISPTHGEFIMCFPTWAGITVEKEGEVRVKFKKEEKQKAQNTAHFVVSTIQISEMFAANFKNIFEILRQKHLISFSHIQDRITPHSDEMLKDL